MGKTYTDNLHLELQEDPADYLDFEAITNNWKKIDNAIGEIMAIINPESNEQTENS
jgi:hypothetical protein